MSNLSNHIHQYSKARKQLIKIRCKFSNKNWHNAILSLPFYTNLPIRSSDNTPPTEKLMSELLVTLKLQICKSTLKGSR